MTTGSLPTFSSTVETWPSPAWRGELPPSSLIAGALRCEPRGLGGSAASLFALQVLENPRTAPGNLSPLLFLLLPTAAEAPAARYFLSPVGQTLCQVLGSNILILLLLITLHNGCYF